MNRYIALLRGVNISGKNKINMSELKTYFTDLGYTDVLTYLNSGNVIFSSKPTDETILSDKIRSMIQERFQLDVPVFVIMQKELKIIMNEAPDWWDTNEKEIYDNLIFVMPSATAESIAVKAGEPTKDLERIRIYKNVIFWSFNRAKYSKANWWKKTASTGICEMITIRTANTLNKIVKM